MAAHPVKVGVLQMHALVGYFRSVAMAMEIQSNTRAEWRTYDESTVLNIAYAMLPWKEKPGTMEVVQNWRAIDARTQEKTAHLLETFFGKLRSGPATAGAYAEQMQWVRQQALQSVQDLFNDANRVNAMVAQEAANGARNMALVQFGCTILLAATGCYLALGGAVPAVMSTGSLGLKAAGVGLGYNIVGALVKDSVSWKSAGAIAIETGKTGTGEFMSHAVPNAQTALVEKIAGSSNQIQATEANIAKLNTEIARKTSEKKIARLAAEKLAKEEGIRRAEQEVAKNTMKRGALNFASRGVPLVFLAHDVYNAWGDLSDTWSATK